MRVLGTDLGCSTWRSLRITTVTHHPNHLSISVNKNEPIAAARYLVFEDLVMQHRVQCNSPYAIAPHARGTFAIDRS